MSLPVTDIEFDDEIDRAWSRFHDDLVSRLSTITADEVVSYVRERPDADSGGATPDLAFRQLHQGVICAVLAVDVAIPADVPPPGWSRTGPGHLTGVATIDEVADLVEVAVLSARRIWGITHPSFLRTVAARPVAGLRSRAAAMADHPAGGIGRTVRRVVHERLAGSVEVDHYQALELRYPDALVQLQLWEVERSALLWTTIRGVIDPDRLDAASAILDAWPGLELVSEGSVIDVEFAIDLSDRPSRTMIAALDRWHAFMRDGYAAVVDALVAPGADDPHEVPRPLRTVLRRLRDDRPATAADTEALTGLGRDVLLDCLDLCRRRSISWMSWADRRRDVGDADGSATACLESQIWDAAYLSVGDALRAAMSPSS